MNTSSVACLLVEISERSTGSCSEEITLITGEQEEGCEEKIPEETPGDKVMKEACFAIIMSPCVLSDNQGFSV